MYQLQFSPQALDDLRYWKKSGQKKTLEKIFAILKQLEEHPYEGIGHPEQLKGNLSGMWSRQISKKDRIVYSVSEQIVMVDVLSVKGHYNDK